MGNFASDYTGGRRGKPVVPKPKSRVPSPYTRAMYILDRQAARETPEWQAHVARKYKQAQAFRRQAKRRN